MSSLDLAVDTLVIPKFDPKSRPESEFNLILRLDSYTDPGLSEAEFQKLFAKCHHCSLFMTRRTISYHDCYEAVENL
jgi:hypothetical protein